VAKFADDGSSRILRGRDLLGLVVAHVGYELGTPEQELHDHSPLISFSEVIETAFGFSERTRRRDLITSTIEDATHFVWALDVDQLERLEAGRYALRFLADPANCEDLVNEQLRRGLELEARTGDMDLIGQACLNLAAMSIAKAETTEHYAELIDVTIFVRAHLIPEPLARCAALAMERAERDREWLLYPKDPMHDGPGYSSRFPMNRCLSVCSYLKDSSLRAPSAPVAFATSMG
jgi:hypothetical protein